MSKLEQVKNEIYRKRYIEGDSIWENKRLVQNWYEVLNDILKRMKKGENLTATELFLLVLSFDIKSEKLVGDVPMIDQESLSILLRLSDDSYDVVNYAKDFYIECNVHRGNYFDTDSYKELKQCASTAKALYVKMKEIIEGK